MVAAVYSILKALGWNPVKNFDHAHLNVIVTHSWNYLHPLKAR